MIRATSAARSVGPSSPPLTLLVRQAVRSSASRQRSSAVTISGRMSPASSSSTRSPESAPPSARASVLELLGEAGPVQLSPLEPGPRVVEGVGGVDPADEALGQALLALVAGEGVERAGQDDPSEVPQDGAHHGAAG